MYSILKALFLVALGYAVTFMALFFETPIQQWILVALDDLKRGRGLLFVRGVRFSLVAVFLYSVSTSFLIIRRHAEPIGFASRVNLTCQIIQALLAGDYLSRKACTGLRTSLKNLASELGSGFSIFTSVMINKTYNLAKEHCSFREIIKAEEKRVEDIKNITAKQQRTLLRDIAALTEQKKRLEFNSQLESKRVEAANARVLPLKNRVDELQLKYDELLEYNQTIRNQLQYVNSELQNNKHSDEKMCNMMFDNEAEATNWCRQYLFPDAPPLPTPRHRRPIYQC